MIVQTQHNNYIQNTLLNINLMAKVPPERGILWSVASDQLLRLHLLGLQRGGSGSPTRAVQQLSASVRRGLHASVEQRCQQGGCGVWSQGIKSYLTG